NGQASWRGFTASGGYLRIAVWHLSEEGCGAFEVALARYTASGCHTLFDKLLLIESIARSTRKVRIAVLLLLHKVKCGLLNLKIAREVAYDRVAKGTQSVLMITNHFRKLCQPFRRPQPFRIFLLYPSHLISHLCQVSCEAITISLHVAFIQSLPLNIVIALGNLVDKDRSLFQVPCGVLDNLTGINVLFLHIIARIENIPLVAVSETF